MAIYLVPSRKTNGGDTVECLLMSERQMRDEMERQHILRELAKNLGINNVFYANLSTAIGRQKVFDRYEAEAGMAGHYDGLAARQGEALAGAIAV